MFFVIISISIYIFGIYLILVLSTCNAIQSTDCHVRYFNKLSIYLFEFRFESLKSISVLILFVCKLMIGSSKNNRENIRENAFEQKKKKHGLNLTPS